MMSTTIHPKRETIQIMHQKADEIRGFVSAHGFVPDCDIGLGDHLTGLGDMYREGTIFYKRYYPQPQSARLPAGQLACFG